MSENTLEKGAKMPENLPDAPWRVGEARPAFSLAMGTEDMVLAMRAALSIGAFGAIGVSKALQHWGGVSLAAESESIFIWTMIIGANYVASPACVAMEQWLARSGAARRLSAAGTAGMISSKISVVELGDTMHKLGVLARAIAVRLAKKAASLRGQGGSGAGSVKQQKNVAPAKSRLAIRLEDLTAQLSAARENRAGLSEKGAWRLARHFAAKDKPVEAAQVWLAMPFNPDWGIIAVGQKPVLGLLFGAGMPFGEWVSRMARSEPDDLKAQFLSDASGLMMAAKDGLAIAEASTIAEPEELAPAKKIRL